MKIKKILFVCTDNTCRSPMAEIMFKNMTHLKDVEIVSRGVTVLFPEPFNPKAVAVLRGKGLILENRTTCQVQVEDFGENCLVLALGIKEKESLMEEFEPANLYTITEFAGETGEIIDPYGKDMEAYVTFADSLEYWLRKVEKRLELMEILEDSDDKEAKKTDDFHADAEHES